MSGELVGPDFSITIGDITYRAEQIMFTNGAGVMGFFGPTNGPRWQAVQDYIKEGWLTKVAHVKPDGQRKSPIRIYGLTNSSLAKLRLLQTSKIKIQEMDIECKILASDIDHPKLGAIHFILCIPVIAVETLSERVKAEEAVPHILPPGEYLQ